MAADTFDLDGTAYHGLSVLVSKTALEVLGSNQLGQSQD